MTNNTLTLTRPLAENITANPEDVRRAKLFLQDLGFYQAPDWGVTDVPDRALFDAIRQFQQAGGLKPDGVMNPGGPSENAIRKIHTTARQLQGLGRHGDTILAHITPAEAELLHKVTDGGTINPATGLPEFFLGDFFSGLSSNVSSMGDSFMSGLDSFSDSLSSIGDNLTSGFSSLSDGLNSGIDSLFGDNALGETADKTTKASGSLGDSLNANLDTGNAVKALPESSNLLQETSTNNLSNDSLFRQFRKNAGLSPDTPPKPKPVRTISAHNAFGNNRTDSGLPRPKPLPRAKAAPFNAMGDRTRPSLSDESLSSNRRLADSLAKSSDFTGIKRHIKPGLDKADPLAVAETHDLINQMNKASPGHGDRLARELGLDANMRQNIGSPSPQVAVSNKSKYQSPIDNNFREELHKLESQKDGYEAFNSEGKGIGALGRYLPCHGGNA